MVNININTMKRCNIRLYTANISGFLNAIHPAGECHSCACWICHSSGDRNLTECHSCGINMKNCLGSLFFGTDSLGVPQMPRNPVESSVQDSIGGAFPTKVLAHLNGIQEVDPLVFTNHKQSLGNTEFSGLCCFSRTSRNGFRVRYFC